MSIHLFERMKEVEEPSPVVFVSALCASSHAGLVEEGLAYFSPKSEEFSFIPRLEHLSCIVGLLGRTGQLDVAATVMLETPFHHDSVMCLSMRGACLKQGN